MSETVVLKAEKRSGLKRRANEALRSEGKIPGVIYGRGEENFNVSVITKELVELLDKGHRIVDLDVEGEKKSVLVKQVQYGIYDHQLLHVDFEHVNENTKIQVSVEVVFDGEAAGTKVGGIVEQELHEIDLECKPASMPYNIQVDISGLEVDSVIHVSDLPEMEGITFTTAPETPVAVCHMPAGEEAEGEGEEGGAEPEVIGESAEE